MKRLNVSIDDELHRDLKMAAVAKSITIGKYVEEAIAEKLKRDEGQEDEKR